MRTFGSDPELMLFLNETPRSAIGIVKGNIEDRLSVNGHQFYYDNVLAECAIKPGSTKKEVVENFQDCLQIYANMVSPYRLVPMASMLFDDSELNHDDARRVGCAKDFCAYEMQIKDAPVEEIAQGNLRSCGGHIHVGADILLGDGPEPILAVYMMDLLVGVPSLWLDQDPTSPRRRAIYGKAGRYRTKPYGMEYRPLGNFWLESPDMVSLIYDLTMQAIECVENGIASQMWDFDLEKYIDSGDASDAWTCKKYDPNLLRQGINETDQSKVKDHMKLAESLMPKKLVSNLHSMINRKLDNTFYQNWNIK